VFLQSLDCTTDTPSLLVEGRVRPAAWILLTVCRTGEGARPSTLTYRLHFVADFFGFAEDAEQVAAENLADIVGAVAAIEQGLCDFGQVGGGVDAGGSGSADAVEIRAEADVIDAGNFGDVVDVIDQRTERRAGNFGGPLALDAVVVEVGDGLARGFS
jgi:hypothetical protein